MQTINKTSQDLELSCYFGLGECFHNTKLQHIFQSAHLQIAFFPVIITLFTATTKIFLIAIRIIVQIELFPDLSHWFAMKFCQLQFQQNIPSAAMETFKSDSSIYFHCCWVQFWWIHSFAKNWEQEFDHIVPHFFWQIWNQFVHFIRCHCLFHFFMHLL